MASKTAKVGTMDSLGRRIGGPPRLFVNKAQITRSGVMTADGNKLCDEERARIAAALGFEKELSIGCLFELLLNYVREHKIVIDADEARRIADKVNAKTAKEAASAA